MRYSLDRVLSPEEQAAIYRLAKISGMHIYIGNSIILLSHATLHIGTSNELIIVTMHFLEIFFKANKISFSIERI